jgi:hypothetical protein
MEVRVATTVRERPALDDAALKRIHRRVPLVPASRKAISKQRLTGKLSFSFHQVYGQELAPAVFSPCTTRTRMPSFTQLRI